MAAEQIPGRLCACGCLGSLEGFPRQQRRLPECQLKHRRTRRNLAEPKLRVLTNKLPPASGTDVPRQRVPVCKVCCGLPWARVPERWGDDGPSGLGDPIVGDNGLCRGCGGAYEPEPEPERQSALGSSAGTLARHGSLFGVEYMGRTDMSERQRALLRKKNSRTKYG